MMTFYPKPKNNAIRVFTYCAGIVKGLVCILSGAIKPSREKPMDKNYVMSGLEQQAQDEADFLAINAQFDETLSRKAAEKELCWIARSLEVGELHREAFIRENFRKAA